MEKVSFLKAAALAGACAMTASAAMAEGQLSNSMARMDANGDGKVTVEEFSADKPGLFKKVNANGDDGLSKDEVTAYYTQKGGTEDGKLEGRVNGVMRADANGDGKVTLDELNAQAAADFKKRDKNGDGAITAAD